MKDIARNITIRLATAEAIGSGFYLKSHDLIITAEHIVRGYRKIIIEGHGIPRQLAEVVYLDAMLDIAFLRTSSSLQLPTVAIQASCEEDLQVVSYAYPFTEGELRSTGYIDNSAFDYQGAAHIMHDAVLGNAANGSGLFSSEGMLLGLNNFIVWKGRAVGMALPISVILEAASVFVVKRYALCVKCPECGQLVDASKNTECRNCGFFFSLYEAFSDYTPKGVAHTIESLLSSMGYTLELARIGRDHWQVERGSASVNITYYEKNGLIIGDAYMCKLPDRSNEALYEFLLRQNNEMENLTFSVKGDDIILSLLIYDRYLNEQTGTELLTNLLEKADHFDNILVNQYQCLWASSRKLT